MAIANSGDGQYLNIASGLFSYNSAYTICAWVRPGAIDSAYHGVIAVNADGSNLDTLLITNGNVWGVGSFIALSGGYVSGSAVAVNTWYHIALVRTNSTTLLGYVNGALNITRDAVDVTGRTANDNLTLGAYDWNTAQELDGRIAHVKVWTAALSASDIAQEMYTVRPATNLTTLWAWWPLLVGDRLRDWSGNGRTLSENGTIADAEDPGIPFGGASLIVRR